jgi:Protein of unknown function (DUF2946)
MRQRFQKYLPIVLIALMVQIFAPIGACWAAAIAASDPLAAANICHDGASATGQKDNQTAPDGHRGGSCAICCLASAGAAIDTPKIEAFAVPHRETARVAWHDQTADIAASRTRSNAQARAPPFAS